MRLWDSVKAAASGVEDDGSYDAPNSAENAAARRAAAFRVTAADLDLAAHWGNKPFGVIVEKGGPRGVSTLTAFADGGASLLNEDGTGIVARQSHVHVVNEAKRLVARAADLVPLLSPTDKPSRPAPGSLLFYFLTSEGLLTAKVARSELRSQESPWSPLIAVAEGLVSELSQYLLPDVAPAGPPRPLEFVKSLAMVTVIGGATYAAWLIPIPWIRWPLVGVGLFVTAAALFVFYAMFDGSRDEFDEADAATGH